MSALCTAPHFHCDFNANTQMWMASADWTDCVQLWLTVRVRQPDSRQICEWKSSWVLQTQTKVLQPQ